MPGGLEPLRRLMAFWEGRREAVCRTVEEKIPARVGLASGGQEARRSRRVSSWPGGGERTVRGGWKRRGSWMLSARIAFGAKAEGLVRELRWGQNFSVLSSSGDVVESGG